MITGPFLAGSFSQNNRLSFSFSPTVAVPQGAMLWFVCGSQVAETANVTIADTQGNSYDLVAFNQVPGTGVTFLLGIATNANALAVTDVVTLTSDTRDSWDGCLYYHTGAQGSIFSRDLEYNTVVNPTASVRGLRDMALFATIAVAGPSTDVFTQDPSFGADQKITLATTRATIHASGRGPLVEGDAEYSYAPLLGTARKSLLLLAAFS